MTQIELKVTGMTCNHCKAAVEKAVSSVKGVSKVVVDLARGKATISYDANQAGLDAFKAAIEAAGYGVAG
ncbi:MAG: copper ion binding protein [Firmicutes bacterium]|nr:copper ion binding protein [Bacillota bacterium]